ncbi:MAG: DUF3368 domain-containing protein [Pyrinomonadaceae bacterium]
MPIKKIVIDASPFILLSKSGFIELLPHIFEEVYMPESVSAEIINGRDMAAEKLYDCQETWLIRCLINHSEEIKLWNLGDGETEVLSFALHNENEYLAVVDDRAARNCAKTLGIKTLGTGGILVLAKKRGLIKSVGEALQKLQNVGLYISEEIIQLLKKQTGER